jgi:hypothetical protein
VKKLMTLSLGLAAWTPSAMRLMLACWLTVLAGPLWAERYESLRIGGTVYSNATVLSMTRTDVFIQHAGGLANIKVKSLSPEVLRQIGYEAPPVETKNSTQAGKTSGKNTGRPSKGSSAPPPVTPRPAALPQVEAPPTTPPPVTPKAIVQAITEAAKQAVSKEEAPKGATPERSEAETRLEQVRNVQALAQKWQGVARPELPVMPKAVILGVLVVMVFAYLFFCYCSKLIVEKTGNEAGVLIWLPIVQLLPLLRAAGMPAWWFLLWMLPVVNLIASIVWSFKIVEARGKSVLWAILLILPGTNLIALLYLAFSEGNDEKPPALAIPPPIDKAA